MDYTYAEYFAGIGAPGKAFKRVTERHGDTCKLVYGFEIDKYARNAYCAIHGEDEEKMYHDITDQPEQLPYVDIIFYSPPCQTYSIAGKKQGSTVAKGKLFDSALEGIKKSKPKYAIMENVANLRNQFVEDFKAMIMALEDTGYINYYKVLNSKNYGIPQNRERIFIVSIRKDIYENGIRFEFPKKMKLEKRLKDVLEDEVDEKYYLSEKLLNGFMKHNEKHEAKGTGFIYEPRNVNGVASCLRANAALAATDNTIEVEQVGSLNTSDSFNGNPQVDRVYGVDGLAPTLSTMQGGRQEPKILVNSATKKGYEIATEGDSINLEQPNSKTRRGRVGKQVVQTLTTSCNQAVVEPELIGGIGEKNFGKQHRQGNRVYGTNGVAMALQAGPVGNAGGNSYLYKTKTNIRKLTPLECFRLQGFDDEDYYNAVEAYDKKWKKGASDSQMYKRAGNSITVQVEEELIDNLIYQRKQEVQMTLF
jgi:DNA (cytosine-5)-methyltransferase 1